MEDRFVNRVTELAALERWWESGSALGMVWGRRRIGKSMLLAAFAEGRRSVFHGGTRQAAPVELRRLAALVADSGLSAGRALDERPFASWDEALTHLTLVAATASAPVLLVLDELPELTYGEPALASILRAWADAAGHRSPLRVLVCGSAVRAMQSLVEERSPLYGRFGVTLAVHPFAPHEAAILLDDLEPAERALVFGLLGGVPFYLSLWDQRQGVADNLHRLLLDPAGRLLAEGELLLATEGDAGRQSGPILAAIGTGRTKFSEIADAVGNDPTRTLDHLVRLRLVERTIPITEDPRRSRRRLYHLADPFLALWFSVLDRHRSAIDRGLGETVLPVVMDSLDDALGHRYEAAMRQHLDRLARAGALGPDVVAIGPNWTNSGDEIDAVVLAGRQRVAIALAEAKWARQVSAGRVEASLLRKSASLPTVADPPRLIVAARDAVTDPAPATLTITAADIFSLER